MSLWFQTPSIEQLNSGSRGTLVELCDISMTELTDDSLHGQMLVSNKIKQPFGIVHGGANCVLAETLGSVAANLTCDPSKFHAVGLSITTNHIRAVRNGVIRGVAKANHIGRTTQVWEIKTFNDSDKLTSVTTLTMSIISRLGKLDPQ